MKCIFLLAFVLLYLIVRSRNPLHRLFIQIGVYAIGRFMGTGNCCDNQVRTVNVIAGRKYAFPAGGANFLVG